MSKQNQMGFDLNQLQQARQREAAFVMQTHFDTARAIFLPLAQDKIRTTLARIEAAKAAGDESANEVKISFGAEAHLSLAAAEALLRSNGMIEPQAKTEQPKAEQKSPILTA